MKVRKLELNNWNRFEARSRLLEELRTEFRNSNDIIRESVRRQENNARDEDMFMMLQLLKQGTEEFEKIKTEIIIEFYRIREAVVQMRQYDMSSDANTDIVGWIREETDQNRNEVCVS